MSLFNEIKGELIVNRGDLLMNCVARSAASFYPKNRNGYEQEGLEAAEYQSIALIFEACFSLRLERFLAQSKRNHSLLPPVEPFSSLGR